MLKKADLIRLLCVVAFLSACSDYRKNDYRDNSPTSGQLKVYYDEGLETHVKNQALTFGSQYPRAHVELRAANDDESVLALYNDSCKAIVISRLLNDKEKTMFGARQFTPKYTLVAYSGIALITNQATALKSMSSDQLRRLLLGQAMPSDTSGHKIDMKVLIDRNNSSVMRYLVDSVMRSNAFGPACSSMGTTPETIQYVSANKNVVGIVDFAWLSDRDDPLYKSVADSIRFLSVSEKFNEEALPNQSTFKLGTYPFMRPVYVMRNAGEFTLAKGFESFIAGPKGQLTLLKQGLLPARQPGRTVEINFEPLPE